MEGRPESFVERHGLGGDHVLQRPTLHSRKHVLVDGLSELFPTESEPAAGAAQRLVGCARDDVSVRHGRGIHSTRDKARKVGHVDQQLRSDLPRDLGEGREIDDARVGTAAGDDDLGSLAACYVPHHVEIDQPSALIHAVLHRAKQSSARIDR